MLLKCLVERIVCRKGFDSDNNHILIVPDFFHVEKRCAPFLIGVQYKRGAHQYRRSGGAGARKRLI